VSGSAGDEPAANLTSRIEVAASERPSSKDRITCSSVGRGFLFEQGEHSLGAVGRPRGDNAAVCFAERLRRRHTGTLA